MMAPAIGFGLVPALVVSAALLLLAWLRARWQAAVYQRYVAARAATYLPPPVGATSGTGRTAVVTGRWLSTLGLGAHTGRPASPGAGQGVSRWLQVALGLAGTGVIWLVTGNPYVAPVFGLLAAAGPTLLERRRRRQREQQFIQQLPEALTLISNILAAGGTMTQALRASLPYLREPLLSEFGQVVQDYDAGRSLEEALRRMQARVGVEEISLLIAAILIQQRLGGNLNELLRGTADLLRERAALRQQVNVLTGQVRSTAVILAALPVVLLLYLGLTQPDQIAPLRTTVTGQLMFAVATVFWFAAGGIIQRMLGSVRI